MSDPDLYCDYLSSDTRKSRDDDTEPELRHREVRRGAGEYWQSPHLCCCPSERRRTYEIIQYYSVKISVTVGLSSVVKVSAVRSSSF